MLLDDAPAIPAPVVATGRLLLVDPLDAAPTATRRSHWRWRRWMSPPMFRVSR